MPKKPHYEPLDVFFLLAMCLAVFLIFIAYTTSARAHDWYPIECCHQYDCAPVDKAVTADGVIAVTTKHGTATVPAEMTRRESRDHRMHACIRDQKVICVFLPPGM